jgi:hypothetical protein
MKELSKQNPLSRPSEAFSHSAYSVTTGGSDLLEYDVVEDSEKRFAVQIRRCKYFDFYRKKGLPEMKDAGVELEACKAHAGIYGQVEIS